MPSSPGKFVVSGRITVTSDIKKISRTVMTPLDNDVIMLRPLSFCRKIHKVRHLSTLLMVIS